MEKRKQSAPLCRLLNDVFALNATPRMGWVRFGIRNPESVGEHTLGVLYIVLWFAEMLKDEHAIDEAKLLKMALFHDLAEARMTDIPKPVKDAIGAKRVHDVESATFGEIVDDAGMPKWKYYFSAYESRECIESHIVKAADVVQLLYQLVRYSRQYGADFSEFLTPFRPTGVALLDDVVEEMRLNALDVLSSSKF